MKSKFLLLIISILFMNQFLLAQNPVITSISPLKGAVGSLVTISGTNLSNISNFTIGGKPAIKVFSNDTKLVGMVMPGAVTGLISFTKTSLTFSSTQNFLITTETAPVFLQKGNKLVGTGAVAASNQGNAVALSADGTTAIVGGNSDKFQQGAVWIYKFKNDVWEQDGEKLVGTGNEGNALQGNSVALSADGNVAVVGGMFDNNLLGATWVFVRKNNVWAQEGEKLVSVTNTTDANQGTSVSISADGSTIVAGSPADNNGIGAAWVFKNVAGIWTQQGNKLIGTNYIGNANQGQAVAISADGNTILVGGYIDNEFKGAAWVYKNINDVWVQQGEKLVGSGGSEGQNNQGWSVAISADGNTALVGANFDNYGKGAAWVFINNGTWQQQSKLTPTDNIGESHFGYSISLSADGNTAFIGGYADGNNGFIGGYYDTQNIGAGWLFKRNNTTWAQSGNKFIGKGSKGNAGQGYGVAISADGNTTLIGGSSDNGGTGAVWAFTLNPIVLPVKFTNVIASQKNTGIALKWNIASEINVKQYEVQHLTSNTFKTVDVIMASGLNYYTGVDNNPLSGVNYYRIKSVDNNGDIDYSQTINAYFLGNDENLAVYPNPITSKEFSLKINQLPKGNYQIRLINATGNTVKNFSINYDGLNLTKNIAADLPSGMYILEVISSQYQKTLKLIVN